MERLTESVITAERNAWRQRAKAKRLRAHALHLNSQRLDLLLRAVHGGTGERGYGQAPGHAYLFLNPTTQTIERVLYFYEQKGIFVVPIGRVTYLCDTVTEAEARLYDWAREAGMIRLDRTTAIERRTDSNNLGALPN